MTDNFNKEIDYYNSITTINDDIEDINFLESLVYRDSKGKIFIELIKELLNHNINYTIVKGFDYTDENYKEFKTLAITLIDNIDIHTIINKELLNKLIIIQDNNIVKFNIREDI